MDAQVFWDVIGNYNRQTWIIQIALLVFLLIAVALSYTKKIKWAAKFSLGIQKLMRNIFIKITIKKPCIYCGTRIFCFDERLNFIT